MDSITIHENYIHRGSVSSTESTQSTDLEHSSLSHRKSQVSLISNSLILPRPPESTTALTLASLQADNVSIAASLEASMNASIFSDEDTAFKSFPETQTAIDLGFQPKKADSSDDVDEFFSQQKHFFILSAAGKPIYSMHGSDEILTVHAGIIQTIVSFFEFNPDGKTEQLRSFMAGEKQQTRFFFLNKSPIILMATSSLGESDIQLNQQLDFLYNFLLTILSKPHIDRVFQKRDNFDLRKLLGKADIACLDSICNDMSSFNNPGLVIGGLECLKMRRSVRRRIESVMLANKSENLLYGLLVAPNGRLITVLRPRRHTLHTSDLQLLFSMIYNTNTFKTTPIDNNSQELAANEEFWVPICFPKFNPNGFLYSFIQFVDLKEEKLMQLHDLNMGILDEDLDPDSSKITVILVSAYKDSFFEMRKIANSIVKSLKLNRTLFRELFKAIVGTQGINGDTGPSSGKVDPVEIPAPLVQHFVFKSKKHTQFIFSRLAHYKDPNENMRGQLMLMYSHLHARFATSSKTAVQPNESDILKDSHFINLVKWAYLNDTLVGLLITTSNYELYLITNGGIMDEKVLLHSCKNIIKWCKKNQERLFISGGAIF
ncbi:hypothetical protein OGAPHI_002314 [Ogataea philodendri]|uniref:Vacuolar fusion protein MON1 n=1 Tax=Ogataea philodendri TaxID=1378263 RepID=A0A9P8PBL1_9ASCO|nr:uncharacterized protein OGAPHI_002314 [Ogataea philodendri]KAH3668560.1 hypothetical protein OGAPHI_002314 [Ogataea philodendri]